MHRRFWVTIALFALTALAAPASAQAPFGYDPWSGLYAGVNLGAAVDDSRYSLTPSGCFLNGCGTGGVAGNPARSFSGSFGQSGIIGGGQVGYNYRLTPDWLVGAEADLQ